MRGKAVYPSAGLFGETGRPKSLKTPAIQFAANTAARIEDVPAHLASEPMPEHTDAQKAVWAAYAHTYHSIYRPLGYRMGGGHIRISVDPAVFLAASLIIQAGHVYESMWACGLYRHEELYNGEPRPLHLREELAWQRRAAVLIAKWHNGQNLEARAHNIDLWRDFKKMQKFFS